MKSRDVKDDLSVRGNAALLQSKSCENAASHLTVRCYNEERKLAQNHKHRSRRRAWQRIALGELYYGAEHSVHVEKGLAEVDELAKTMIIVSTDSTTAKVYGYAKHELRV